MLYKSDLESLLVRAMNTDIILQSKIKLQETEALIVFSGGDGQTFEHFELVINASVEEKNYYYKSTCVCLSTTKYGFI
jgi:hypothetical protein